MTYKCRYKNNPIFPYSNKFHKLKKGQPLKSTSCSTSDTSFSSHYKINKTGLFDKLLSPIEKFIGRKIDLDDIILVALIYLLYTEKDDENTTLLLCLIFILID